jgi:hypothetical protein
VTPQPIGEADRYAVRLLDHDGLMTPILLAEFGPLRAVQTVADHADGLFHRRSVLRRVPGDEAILDASLKISVQALPDGFLQSLVKAETLFGQALQDHGIKDLL